MSQKIEEGWPDVEAQAQPILTDDEKREHRRAIFTLFGGSLAGYILFAYAVGAPPLRNAVAQTWSGFLALVQLLW